MRLGSQSITVVSVAENLDVRDAYKQPTTTRTETTVVGCRVRPTPSSEQDGRVLVGLRVTAPPVPAVLAAKSTDEVTYLGDTYQVIGLPRVHTDFSGRASHVTFEVARYLA